MMERTLVLIKPDGVQRQIAGRILQRFEDVGLKIIGMKLVQPSREHSTNHYADVGQRRGQKVLDQNINFLAEGPVIALVLEGIQSIELVRKMVGSTEPKSSPPGTIRGDFSHQSYAWCDTKGQVIRNLIHASSSKEDAQKEIALWFAPNELYDYKTVHEQHTFGK
ncbi:MAG: nucleoside-diphosphate kinase [Candidatus Diapherotrites archaeon]